LNKLEFETRLYLFSDLSLSIFVIFNYLVWIVRSLLGSFIYLYIVFIILTVL